MGGNPIPEAFETVKWLILKALDTLESNEMIRGVRLVPQPIELSSGDTVLINNLMSTLGYKQNNNEYENVINGYCYKIKLEVDGYRGLIAVNVWREELERCSPKLLAELLKKHLYLKEVEA